MSLPLKKRLRSATRVNQGSVSSLSDDLLRHILIRLPLEDVLHCRAVCRRWRDLSSTRYFVHTHLRSSAPMILILTDARDESISESNEIYYYRQKSNEFFFTEGWEPGPGRSIIRRLNKCRDLFKQNAAQCSRDGLLVLKSGDNLRKFIVFNPVYRKKVTIELPKEIFGRTEALAIYFHPVLKEYCILGAIDWLSDSQSHYEPDEKGIQYMILILGSKPYWRKIHDPWIHKVKNPYKPTLLLGRYLYWLVKSIAVEDKEYSGKFAIMEFDILTEELKVRPSPVTLAVKCQGYNKGLLNNENISLLDVGGLLSLFLISPRETRIYQWTLISCEEELWTSSIYNVSGFRASSILNVSGFSFSNIPLRAVALVDERLFIESHRIFVVNLKRGMVHRLEKYYSFSTFLPHAIGLTSLKHCKSKITINEEEDKEMNVETNYEELVTSRKDANFVLKWEDSRHVAH